MCELTTITGKVAGATGAAINARKSGSAGYSYHTASNLTLSVIDQWTSAASVDNITYQPGDSLEFIFSGSAGVTGIFIQADFRRI